MYKQFLSAFAALAWGASTVVAIEHGEYGNYAGLEVRWQQVGPEAFTGVPADKWDDAVHKRDDQVLDMTNFKRTLHPEDVGIQWFESRDALDKLQDRNFNQKCQAVVRCVKNGAVNVVAVGQDLWVQYATAAAAKKGYKNVMDFLNQPFYANAGGVAIAGIVSGQTNAALAGTSCSTTASANDTLGAIIAAAVASNPEGQTLNIQVTGNSSGFTLNISAGPTNTHPSTSC
ncbi:hypothetical protein AB5N19_07024 [Seiridium cardinale]|uniref:Uncharacterized protein n=1 Tax=Seiridium cardinale TaxID=138064 RepID=A0ABR2XE63_9PEZI